MLYIQISIMEIFKAHTENTDYCPPTPHGCIRECQRFPFFIQSVFSHGRHSLPCSSETDPDGHVLREG